ncbi:CPBP family intramembrane metalloprotease [Microbacterium sp. EYE_5]|uniref:CPBP family intramembrane glutamic endopeptidase n=1 Tax=unclassified Microbacterium TaxID=2609290 RepID=UPI002005FB32|nr:MULTISPECIES: CPBP family intramembrane glutamic endopeptidase [unclassified Microbacterium]MCK6081305.1 CPBP family intramembrane metalloprotease [Microbacterium sp. EYE_382]MCK6086575.1 CPBP family intramembrane metalloprotease [Microbacterium sp. EYE_384]MCK6123927.1 CPBP family intramembrane metalloprotease [Microbacterium sp. EYE_80]MCK6126836.1 CPBP family intramembrane metalloprotease [Microbacterium sp. EYE_79]MCK6142260.1 CPBP family intramembrane metalloprotease [Microbacterium sp
MSTDLTPAASAPTTPDMRGTTTVPWIAVIAFTVLACGLAWLVTIPLWMGDGLATPIAPLILPVMMFTPAVAALIVTLFLRRSAGRRAWRMLALVPIKPLGRFFGMLGIAVGISILVPVLATFIAAATGALQLDLVNFSGFAAALQAQLDAAGAPNIALPVGVLVVIQLVSIPVGAVINSFLAFGEELGWRGWLFSALRPLGIWPTLLIAGVIWGLWHSPIILLGYNFAEPNLFGVALMVVGCLSFGILLGWLRLRSDNVWPAVLGHGAFNAAAGFAFLVSTPDLQPLAASPLSWPGWLACAAVILLLLALGQFKKSRLPQTGA